MDRERLFYLAFNFDPATGAPVIYRPFYSDIDEADFLEEIYDHFFHCIKEYFYNEVIPPRDVSLKLFGDNDSYVVKGDE